jgi:hypothetical protein
MCYLMFFLSFALAFSVNLLSPMDGARSAQAGESVQGESPGQSADMDRHDHAEGTVDMMTPHQKYLGLHMRWTGLRTAEGKEGVRNHYGLNSHPAPASRPRCLGRVRADPSCFLNYMHVTNPSVDTLLSAK